jgi:group I intron endonuclease
MEGESEVVDDIISNIIDKTIDDVKGNRKKKEIICGIYCIENLDNGLRYIGFSKDIMDRWSNHKKELNKKYHYNRYLQRSWNKYGQEKFKFWIIQECKKEKLKLLEIYWIAFYNSYIKDKGGYNLTRGGEGIMGYKPTEETLIKMSIATSGSCNPMFSRKQSNETKQLISKQRLESGSAKGSKNNKSVINEEIALQVKIMLSNGNSIKKIMNLFNVSRDIIKNIKYKITWKDIGPGINPIKTYKLNENDVREIKKMLINGIDDEEIANKFSVTYDLIGYIRRGKIWKDVKPFDNVDFVPINKNNNLTIEKVKEIKKMLVNGTRQRDITKIFNITRGCVSLIKTGRTWKDVII